jgi:FkbH-like protein
MSRAISIARRQAERALETARRDGSHAGFADARRAIQPLLGELPPLSVRVLSSDNVDALLLPLELEVAALGRRPVCSAAGFDQWRQELFSGSPAPVDFTAVLVDREALGEPAGALAELTGPLAAALERPGGHVLVANAIVPWQTRVADGPAGGEAARWRSFDDELARWAGERPRVRVVDLDAAAAGFGKTRVRDERLFAIGRMLFAPAFVPHLARALARHLAASLALGRKCLVLDLDGTLWGGLLGEDGPQGIALEGPIGGAFVAFQRSLKALAAEGVLLAIASKNDPDDVRAVLRGNPSMVLREEDIVASRVGWQDKSASVAEIASELGVGLDTLVFWDDSPVERLRVASELPDVILAEPPEDPAGWPRYLAEQTWFERLATTDEDRGRTRDTRAQAERARSRSEAGSLDEFLRGLAMRATLRADDLASLDRIAQLVQKTNQYNLTSRRHDVASIRTMITGPHHHVYSLSIVDRFGSAGLVGVAIVAIDEACWTIDTLLLSCRVIGRRLETVLLGGIDADARAAGASELLGELVPTPRNEPVRSLLPDHGFTSDAGGRWRRPVDPPIVAPDFIELHREG